MANRERTVPERVADWYQAYQAIRAELTSEEARAMVSGMTKVPVPTGEDVTEKSLLAYANLVNSSLSLTSIVSSNDRTAATVAEALTRNGLTRTKESI